MAQHDGELTQTIGGLLPHTLALDEKQLTYLLQGVVFIAQIILLYQELR